MTADIKLSNFSSAAGVVVLLLTVIAVFARAIGFDFVNYDDFVHIKENPLICNFSLASLTRVWSAPYEGLYMPLTYTAWGILSRLSALFSGTQPYPSPSWFHGMNLAVHLGVVVVLFRLLQRILNDTLGALAGALLFAVHPVQVETVAWVSSLKELLAGLGTLVSVWL